MQTVGNEYGGALFLLAEEEGLLEVLLPQLRAAEKLFNENPGYIELLRAPNIPAAERTEAVSKAFDGKMHEYVCSFIKLLTERGHIREFSACVREYERLYDAYLNISRARAASAVELSAGEKAALKSRLEALSGHEVIIEYAVDKALLGGITVRMDGKLLDGSLKTRIEAIKEKLKN